MTALRHGIAVLGLTALLGIAPRASAEDEPSELAAAIEAVATDPLAAAPIDTWPMQDGCPARTRATLTPPILGPTEVAWSYEAPGEIEGDPRVWKDWVVIASGTEKASYLDVLRLSDGKRFATRHTYGSHALNPAIWGDSIEVTSDSGIIEWLRIVPALNMLAKAEGSPSVDSPFIAAGMLVRYGSLPGVLGEVGRVSARGGLYYTLARNPVEGYKGLKVTLEVVSFAKKAVVDSVDLGWESEGARDEDSASSYVVVGDRDVVAVHPAGVMLKDGPDATATYLRKMGSRHLPMTLLHIAAHPLAWGLRTIVPQKTDDEGEALTEVSSSDLDLKDQPLRGWRYRILASPKRSPAYTQWSPLPIVARGTVIAAAGSFDVETRRIVEAPDRPRTGVMIPARETMLVVEDGRRLVARRRPKPPGGEATGPTFVPDAAAPKTEVKGATTVTVDGVVRTGAATLSPKGDRVTIAGTAVPLAELGVLLDPAGRLLHGPDAAVVARSIPRAVAERTRPDWTSLAKKAANAHDAPTLRRAIEDLVERGGKPSDLDPLRVELGRLDHPSALTPPRDAARVAEVEAKRSDLAGAEAKALWTAVASLPEATPFAYRIDMIRAILASDPGRPEALDWVRGRLPAGLAPAEGFKNPLDWLDVVEAASETPLGLVEGKETGALTPDQRVLAVARASWRKDLVALRSHRLLLVTPVAKPGRIARCLSLGELVCSELDRVFGVAGKAADEAEPLVIYLYETKDEYVKASPAAQEGAEGKAWVEWTLGHYSPGEGVSRLFVPEGREAFEGVMHTFVHELTHHWLDRRMPAADGAKGAYMDSSKPGYFLEEGFATMVEEWEFDLRARTVRTLNPRADSLDAVASAPDLLKWAEVTELPQDRFRGLSREPNVDVPCRWTLGQSRRMSAANLFYAQAAAICHRLFQPEGGHRAALLAWVQALHAGRAAPGDPARRVQMPPAQLGADVLAWCRRVSRGE